MDEDILLGNSEAPILETPATLVTDAATAETPADESAVDTNAAAGGEEDDSGAYVSFTAIKPDTQLRFLKLVLQLRGLKFKKTVEAPIDSEDKDEGAAAAAASSSVEIWDTTTGPQLSDALRRRVFKEITGAGVAGASSDSDLVDSCVNDALRAFGKKLAKLDGTAVIAKASSKGDKKKSRKEKSGAAEGDDEKKSKKEKKNKKEKKSKKEKKQKRSKFIDDMAGESSDDDY